MVLKISLIRRFCLSRFFMAAMISLILSLIGCSGLKPVSTPDTSLPVPEIVDKPDSHLQDSRVLASHSLTREGYQLLKKNDFDGAIRLLERAVGVNPSDGPGYFYLAEAWLGKNNFNLAAQFNRLASLYLRDDATWSRRAEVQKKRIERGLKGL